MVLSGPFPKGYGNTPANDFERQSRPARGNDTWKSWNEGCLLGGRRDMARRTHCHGSTSRH